MTAARSYITITDDSISASVGTSSLPLIVLATAANKKIDENGTAVYSGTAESNVLRLIAGQQDLISRYGSPIFPTEDGTVLQGDERSEWGLWSAYSFLGASNLAYVIRADIDLDQLTMTEIEPSSPVKNGTIWFDTAATSFGVFRSNGNLSKNKAWDVVAVKVVPSYNLTDENEPSPLYGQNGDIAVVTVDSDGNILNTNCLYEKISGSWYHIGTEEWYEALPTTISGTPDFSILTTGIFSINGIQIELTTDIYSSIDSIVETINSAKIENIVASVDGASIVLQNTVGGYIELQDVTENMLSMLGFTAGRTEGVDVFYRSHTNIPSGVAGSIWVKTTSPNNGSDYVIKQYSTSTQQWVQLPVSLYQDEIYAEAGLGSQLSVGSIFVDYPEDKITSAIIKKYAVSGGTTLKGTIEKKLEDVLPVDVLRIRTLKNGSVYTYSIESDGILTVADFLNETQKLNIEDFEISLTPDNFLEITRDNGGAYELSSDNNTWALTFGISETIHSKWENLSYIPSTTTPRDEAEDGTYWINSDYKVDIMITNGTKWVGFHNYNANLDPKGPQVTSLEPITQSDGSELVSGDIWIDPSQSERYPAVYKWDADEKEWNVVDLTDQTTPDGIVFADARENAGPAFDFSESAADLAISDFVDPDAPDPRAYPAGMMLFNTRYSTRNVKVYQSKYFEEEIKSGTTYTVGESDEFPMPGTETNPKISRWTTISGNELDGKPYMGRKAQRIMVVRALASTIVSNQDIRAEDIEFNLLACPGYVECYDEMVTLATDRRETCYIVADCPARLAPDATAISEWAKNSNNAASNGDDGLTTRYTYSCMCYPWGLGTNLDGYEVAIPSSAMKLRQLAVSDSMTNAVWKPAAGVRRGIVSNAASVGYIDSENEYQSVKLQSGLRDVLFDNGINPIYNIPGYGLTIWGDKTLSSVNSALDAEGVARMVVMMRSDLDKMVKPFFFELNTKSTRDSVKNMVEGYLQGIMAREGLDDFVVVCDDSNNTPARKSNHELWIDIAILPTYSIRWIYIPIRIVNDSSKL